jgi:flagellar motor switch protein FliM
VPGDTLADWSRGCRAWALQVRALGAGRALTLLLSARRMELLAPVRAVPQSAALTSRRQAVGGKGVSLRAVVGEMEMSVSELAGIAIDDVLVLDQRLSEPVALLAGESHTAVAAGNLGRAGSRRAVKITGIPAHKN